MSVLNGAMTSNWRPAKGVCNHDQGRPGAPLRATSLRLRMMEKDWAKISSELARDVVNTIGDAG